MARAQNQYAAGVQGQFDLNYANSLLNKYGAGSPQLNDFLFQHPNLRLAFPQVTSTITYLGQVATGGSALPNAWSVSTTLSLAGPGAALGGAVGGVPGAFVGYAIGSMFGFGATVSWSSTGAYYAGPTLSFAPQFNQGTGLSVSGYYIPPGQNPNGIFGGLSGSVNIQPSPITGTSFVQSPGSPAVGGPAFGTKTPITFSGGYGFCVWDCHP